MNAKSVWKVGPAAPAFAKMADEGAFDLLIMGSHGRRRATNLVMGSVATQVLAHCKVPVLLVRPARARACWPAIPRRRVLDSARLVLVDHHESRFQQCQYKLMDSRVCGARFSSAPLDQQRSRTCNSGGTLTPQPACTARTWPSVLGAKALAQGRAAQPARLAHKIGLQIVLAVKGNEEWRKCAVSAPANRCTSAYAAL